MYEMIMNPNPRKQSSRNLKYTVSMSVRSVIWRMNQNTIRRMMPIPILSGVTFGRGFLSSSTKEVSAAGIYENLREWGLFPHRHQKQTMPDSTRNNGSSPGISRF
jgi:hypothetical protein